MGCGPASCQMLASGAFPVFEPQGGVSSMATARGRWKTQSVKPATPTATATATVTDTWGHGEDADGLASSYRGAITESPLVNAKGLLQGDPFSPGPFVCPYCLQLLGGTFKHKFLLRVPFSILTIAPSSLNRLGLCNMLWRLGGPLSMKLPGFVTMIGNSNTGAKRWMFVCTWSTTRFLPKPLLTFSERHLALCLVAGLRKRKKGRKQCLRLLKDLQFCLSLTSWSCQLLLLPWPVFKFGGPFSMVVARHKRRLLVLASLGVELYWTNWEVMTVAIFLRFSDLVISLIWFSCLFCDSWKLSTVGIKRNLLDGSFLLPRSCRRFKKPWQALAALGRT